MKLLILRNNEGKGDFSISIFVIIAVIVSLVIIWIGFIRFSYMDIVTKMTNYYLSRYGGEIDTFIVRGTYYDEYENVLKHYKSYKKMPGRIRFEEEDFKGGGRCVYIRKKNEEWNSCPQDKFFLQRALIELVISDLYILSRISDIRGFSVRKVNMEGVDYYLVRYKLAEKKTIFRIDLYVSPFFFRYLRIKIFTFNSPQWEKIMELRLYSTALKEGEFKGFKVISNIKGIFFVGKKANRFEIIRDSVEVNEHINDNIFNIPVKKEYFQKKD